jgi:PBP1b-binding outer membrane lipoprotein LpoB
MTIIDQTSCPADCSRIEARAASLRGALSRLSIPCAISLALALGACAQNPAPHSAAASAPQAKAAQIRTTTLSAPPARLRMARHEPSARIRKLDPALLAPQPVPNCEYKKSDIKTVDAEEWSRLKNEYELQCYRETEAAARTRLGLLQSSVRRLQN